MWTNTRIQVLHEQPAIQKRATNKGHKAKGPEYVPEYSIGNMRKYSTSTHV